MTWVWVMTPSLAGRVTLGLYFPTCIMGTIILSGFILWFSHDIIGGKVLYKLQKAEHMTKVIIIVHIPFSREGTYKNRLRE